VPINQKKNYVINFEDENYGEGAGYWLLGTGCLLLVACCWVLVAACSPKLAL